MFNQRVITLIVVAVLLGGTYLVVFTDLFAGSREIQIIARASQPRNVRSWMISAPIVFNMGERTPVSEITFFRLEPPAPKSSVIVQEEAEGPYEPEIVWQLKGITEEPIKGFTYRSRRDLDGLEQVIPVMPEEEEAVEGESDEERRQRERRNRQARWQSQPPQLEPGVPYRVVVKTPVGVGEFDFTGVPLRNPPEPRQGN